MGGWGERRRSVEPEGRKGWRTEGEEEGQRKLGRGTARIPLPAPPNRSSPEWPLDGACAPFPFQLGSGLCDPDPTWAPWTPPAPPRL